MRLKLNCLWMLPFVEIIQKFAVLGAPANIHFILLYSGLLLTVPNSLTQLYMVLRSSLLHAAAGIFWLPADSSVYFL